MHSASQTALPGFAPSTLLSRLDPSDAENVKDADHQLQRCVTDADYAGWARKWGGAFVSHAIEQEDRSDWIEPDDHAARLSAAADAAASAAVEELGVEVGRALKSAREAVDSLNDTGRALDSAVKSLEHCA